MGCVVVLETQTKAEHVEDAKAFLQGSLKETRAYDGCRGVEVIENMDKPGNLILYERWDTREKYEAYLAWRLESGVMDSFAAMLEGEPSIRFFDGVDV